MTFFAAGSSRTIVSICSLRTRNIVFFHYEPETTRGLSGALGSMALNSCGLAILNPCRKAI